MIEAATHRTYGEVAAELVFEPANLHATTSGAFPDSGATSRSGNIGAASGVHPGFADIPGTGDLWTTTDDLVRLNQADRARASDRAGGRGWLWTPHVEIGGSDDGGPIVMDAYGYGTFLGQSTVARHASTRATILAISRCWPICPTHGLDLAVLCNEDAPSVNAALAELALR